MKLLESFLVAQWLGFQAFTVVARIQSLVGELRIPQALWPKNKNGEKILLRFPARSALGRKNGIQMEDEP